MIGLILYADIQIIFGTVRGVAVKGLAHIADDGQLCEHVQDLEPDADVLCPLSYSAPRLAHEFLVSARSGYYSTCEQSSVKIVKRRVN